MRKILKRAVSISLFAIIISLAIAPSFRVEAGEITGTVDKPETEAATGENATEEMDEIDAALAGLSKEEAIDKLMEMTDEALTENFGKDHKVTRDGDVVIIDIWFDGVRLVADEARKDDQYKESWQIIVDSMQTISTSFYSRYRDYGMNVKLNLLDDTDHEKILVTALNDEIVYDDLNPEPAE